MIRTVCNVIFATGLLLGSTFVQSASGFEVGTIVTAAGGGVARDGASAAEIAISPAGVAADPSGNLYICDSDRILKVAPSGAVTTVAGNGILGYSGDDGPAISASLSYPRGVAVDRTGTIYFSDSGNHRIRKIDNSGIITTVAGNGTAGYGGDEGNATLASLNEPNDLAVDDDGNIFIADTGNDRIRKIGTSGTITTVAGNGIRGFSGDGGDAKGVSLNAPSGIGLDSDRNIYIADTGNNRIRKVDVAGGIATVAGTGISGFSGDFGPATEAGLASPKDAVVDAIGNIFVADSGNSRIRKISPSGTIVTIAGDGANGFTGEGGPAIAASLNSPSFVTADISGNLYVTDSGNARVRTVVGVVADVTPAAFTFSAASDVALNTLVESNAITVAGINAPTPVSISGGEYSVDGGAFTSSTTNVVNGAEVKVRLTSAESYSTARSATLAIGTVSGTFTAGTLPSHNISATAEGHGSISPSGTIVVPAGSTQNFAIAADPGYAIADVVVDGVSVGASPSYSFSNISGPHTITAKFVVLPVLKYSTKAFSYRGASGSVSFTLSGTAYSQSTIISSSSVPWITVDPLSLSKIIKISSRGLGTASIKYRVAANPDGTSREGVILIGGVPFTVSQAGAPCLVKLNASKMSVIEDGGIGQIQVSIPSGCQWNADVPRGAEWIRISENSSGSGSAVVSYAVDKNVTAITRTGGVRISPTGGSGAKTQTVVQAKGIGVLTLTALPASPRAYDIPVTITVSVKKTNGSPVGSGFAVTFTTTAGTLSATSATTDSNGQASVTLSNTGGTGMAVAAGVTAATGGKSGRITVRFPARPPQASIATVKLATRSVQIGKTIGGIEGNIGFTTTKGLTFVSGQASGNGAGSLMVSDSSNPGEAFYVIVNANGIPAGEFITLTFSIAPGFFPTIADFSVTPGYQAIESQPPFDTVSTEVIIQSVTFR